MFISFLRSLDRDARLILALALTGSIAASSLVPVMGLFIVDELGQPPWAISLYFVIVTALTMGLNKRFGAAIDSGRDIRQLQLVSIAAFLLATMLLYFLTSYLVLLIVFAPLISLANTALSVGYSLGRLYAERQGLDIARFNALLRIVTSTGWIFGPAFAFVLLDSFSFRAAFLATFAIAVLRLALWTITLPDGFRAVQAPTGSGRTGRNHILLIAATVSMLLSMTNVLYSSAMPLFFKYEAGLPGYAPGLSFAIKCLFEIPAIYFAAILAQRWGERRVLMAAAMLAVVVMLSITQLQSIPQLILLAAAEGLYYGLFAGAAIGYIQGFAMGRMGQATATYVSSLFLGGMLGSALMGLMASLFDYQASIYLAAAAALAALPVLMLLKHLTPAPNPA
jgi:MFS transporter, SET family, sugar efflux transporter